jgi:hypothetical protein
VAGLEYLWGRIVVIGAVSGRRKTREETMSGRALMVSVRHEPGSPVLGLSTAGTTIHTVIGVASSLSQLRIGDV